MFLPKVLLTLALAFVSQAAAVPGLQKRGDGVVKLDFSITGTKDLPVNLTDIVKRDSLYEYTLHNKGYYYIADLYVGSNSQKVSVDVDTGSSDLWVIDSASGIEGTYGVYDHSSSSSYKYIASGFGVAYADYSQATGDWVSDKVSLSPSGPTIESLEFGDATSTSGINYGILGIGFASLEAASTKYDNLPVALKKSGAIKKNAYSLYLNSADAKTGNVLFGGIDNAKYKGKLTSLPVTSDTRLNVKVKSFGTPKGDVNFGGDVTLDSGSTYSYLDPENLSNLAAAVGATPKLGNEIYGWDSCSDAPDLKINFDGVTLTIPSDYLGGKLQYKDGSESDFCALLVLPDSRFNILGDNFLRTVYAVYDLDDKTISLAEVNYTDEEDISVIS